MAGRALALIAILWAGALWTICGLVAPTLFAVLDDRALAGSLAGTFFNLIAWIGAGAALVLVGGHVGLHRRAVDRRLLAWIGVAALAPLANEWLLVPVMDAARAAGDLERFAALHGVAAVAFAVACLAALAVVVRLTRPAG